MTAAEDENTAPSRASGTAGSPPSRGADDPAEQAATPSQDRAGAAPASDGSDRFEEPASTDQGDPQTDAEAEASSAATPQTEPEPEPEAGSTTQTAGTGPETEGGQVQAPPGRSAGTETEESPDEVGASLAPETEAVQVTLDGEQHRDPEVLAAIPAYNEEVAIGSVVLQAREHVDEVLVVDDASTDATAAVAEGAGATVTVNEENRGKGFSVRRAFAYAEAMEYDALVLLDGDGQHDPGEIPDILEPVLPGGADTEGDSPADGSGGQDSEDQASGDDGPRDADLDADLDTDLTDAVSRENGHGDDGSRADRPRPREAPMDGSAGASTNGGPDAQETPPTANRSSDGSTGGSTDGATDRSNGGGRRADARGDDPYPETEADVSLGFRFGENTEMPLYRRFGKRVLDYATAIAQGDPREATDSQAGFRAFNRRAIRAMNEELSGDGFGIESEQLVVARERGLETTQVPITCRYEGLDASTQGPFRHGLGVLNDVIEMATMRRPLLTMGVPSAVAMVAGGGLGIYVIQYWRWTGYFSLPQAMGAGLLVLLGLLGIMSALILNMMARVERRLLDEDETPPEVHSS